MKDIRFRNPLELSSYISKMIQEKDERFYLFIDEIYVHLLFFCEYYSAVEGDKEDSFLFSKAKRYYVRGKSYFDYPYKYYCEDIGLRNARIGFR